MQTQPAIPPLFRLSAEPSQGRPGDLAATIERFCGPKQSRHRHESVARPTTHVQIACRAALRYIGLEPRPVDMASAATTVSSDAASALGRRICERYVGRPRPTIDATTVLSSDDASALARRICERYGVFEARPQRIDRRYGTRGRTRMPSQACRADTGRLRRSGPRGRRSRTGRTTRRTGGARAPSKPAGESDGPPPATAARDDRRARS
jgi:hypothetical protein